MLYRIFLPAVICIALLSGCAASKNYNPNKKYSVQQLQQDYTLLRKILEAKHPSLYWYTSKDSMNMFFDNGYKSITDSMTELQFGWNVLAPVINKIRCGHTSFSMSKNWYQFQQKIRIPSFPLHLKVWKDTMVIIENLNKKDSILKQGMLVTSINGMRNNETIKTMFDYLPLDGYADNVNYVRISSNFPFYHRNVFGVYSTYRVGYIDSMGKEKSTIVPMYIQSPDTGRNKIVDSSESKITRHQLHKLYIKNLRSFTIDASLKTSVITLNTFTNGRRKHLRHFIKSSFRTIRKNKIGNVILDLRRNGGGDLNMSMVLAKFLRNTPFKATDSAFAVTKSLKPYTGYIKHGFINNLGFFLLTKRRKDGLVHYGYLEHHLFKPKVKNHFNGKLYVLVNGPTFSASTIFCNQVKGQENVKIVGEETGGGWYGNDGVMIPDITLPITKLRVRLPLFRIVQYNHVPFKGTGIMPDIYIPPTVDGVRNSEDRKMEIVKQMIKEENK
ncbi:S41 family peptidase [Ferruginibacter albus]|uniref:S41 family peptidase n=1 Tax=Ferruginibacter albus TaxID=2875540 RepID=UPI001CC40A24|nr:S41 family peptidase [Ferruginibacter albus]UAY52006.1 S41 family peptidase [Ferruginibacter albus]